MTDSKFYFVVDGSKKSRAKKFKHKTIESVKYVGYGFAAIGIAILDPALVVASVILEIAAT